MNHLSPGDAGVRATDVLERMSESPDALAARFVNMPEKDFDAVCCSAIVWLLAEEQSQNGFISIRSVATCINAMRQRYRSIVNTAKTTRRDKTAGEGNHNAKLNEMQSRILRRVQISRKRGVSLHATGAMFGVSAQTVHKIRQGLTWRAAK